MDKNTFSFVVYIIHACANKWGKLPSYVYDVLDRSGCISKYLVPHYDILHTQSTAYIVEDVVEYLKVRGINL
jgi:hypothetical protein